MEPNKILVVFLVLVVGICFADVVIETHESTESSELIDAAVDILTSCYGDRGPIGVVGNMPPTLLRKLSEKLIPVVLFDSSKRIMHDDKLNRKIGRQTLHVFLFAITTKSQIHDDIFTIESYRWWNPSASFLVVNTLTKINAKRILRILNIFLCYELFNVNMLYIGIEKKIEILGFNPHINQAPQPWELIGTIYHKYGPRWFLFDQRYREGNGSCNNLDYDKTKDLGGHGILFSYIQYYDEWSSYINFTRLNHLDMRYIIYIHVWEIYLRQMNATLMRYDANNLKSAYGEYFHSAICIGPVSPHYDFGNPRTMPLFEHPRVIVTQFRGNKSQLRKILTVMDIYSRYCVGLTLFITLIFFKFFTQQHCIPGMLNVIRMICNTGFTNLPENLSSRTFLAGLFVFIITIQGIFSGNLASLLTTQIPVPHPRTIRDLLDMNYTIDVDRAVILFAKEKKYEGRFIHVDEANCPDAVARNASIACVNSKDYLRDMAVKLKLYVSNNDIFTTYDVITSTWRWPLMDRTSEIFLRMSEARILEPLYVKVRQIRLNEIQDYEMEPKPPRVMNFDDLSFAFIILGIGLGCAILSFIIEISINPVRSRIPKVRRHFRH